jgi:hypothetical protein
VNWPVRIGIAAFIAVVIIAQAIREVAWVRLLIGGLGGAVVFCVAYLVTRTVQARYAKE